MSNNINPTNKTVIIISIIIILSAAIFLYSPLFGEKSTTGDTFSQIPENSDYVIYVDYTKLRDSEVSNTILDETTLFENHQTVLSENKEVLENVDKIKQYRNLENREVAIIIEGNIAEEDIISSDIIDGDKKKSFNYKDHKIKGFEYTYYSSYEKGFILGNENGIKRVIDVIEGDKESLSGEFREIAENSVNKRTQVSVIMNPSRYNPTKDFEEVINEETPVKSSFSEMIQIASLSYSAGDDKVHLTSRISAKNETIAEEMKKVLTGSLSLTDMSTNIPAERIKVTKDNKLLRIKYNEDFDKIMQNKFIRKYLLKENPSKGDNSAEKGNIRVDYDGSNTILIVKSKNIDNVVIENENGVQIGRLNNPQAGNTINVQDAEDGSTLRVIATNTNDKEVVIQEFTKS